MSARAPVDDYEAIGELHDLFMADRWARLRPALTAAFGDLPATAHVVDIGAGSGLGTRALATATRARITAIEPSRTMRAQLLARVDDDAGLRARVTVMPGTASDSLTDTPEIDGFLAAHMLGHLDLKARRELFDALGSRLRPRGVGLLTMPAAEPPSESSPSESVERTRIGRLTYTARHRDPGDGTFVSDYEVRCGERVVQRMSTTGRWRMPALGLLERELADAGLTMALLPTLGVGLVTVR